VSRHITVDGRNSLRKYLFSGRNVFSMWSSKFLNAASVPPVIALGLGISLAISSGIHHLRHNPDVHVNKLERKQTLRQNYEEGKKWIQHHASMRTLPGTPVPEPAVPDHVERKNE